MHIPGQEFFKHMNDTMKKKNVRTNPGEKGCYLRPGIVKMVLGINFEGEPTE